ncbi:hypothetical protein [Pseudobutyrivibrio xylanivorans]|uniref:Uncharacterized protein n=1 Tax=Pseudobutyrivibrio xylanivorans TaxID=185007 RepID=A0A5P6VLG6_PSEXY|nr:hypothetical protein [Pseudobutyrivibrio xylanivorans]QFJ53407.1 hypothetical protein FXF36_00225 [Pseudobutyrivibrio xylanivorans]
MNKDYREVTKTCIYTIKYSQYIAENSRDINRMLKECMNISIFREQPDPAFKNGEYLMTADCSAGKTYAFAKDIFLKTRKNHINILASPNVSQVSQNSKKYAFKAVAGKNAVINRNVEDYVATNVIYDKLLTEIKKIEMENDLKDVFLVIDEAHLLVDAIDYRKEAINDVKLACRKVANAGGRVVYLTGTPMSILLTPPDNNPLCSEYKAHIVCEKVGINGKPEVYRNYKYCNIVPYKNVRHLPYELARLADEVKEGGYFLVHNNDKEYNLRAVKFLEEQGISAAAISSDDINYSKVDEIYSNSAYNDIISEGKINLGPIGLGYQVIFTTSLLNNGTSIDELVYRDEDPLIDYRNHNMVKCIYVCNKKEEFNLNNIEQFFLRIRFSHHSNMIVLPESLVDEREVEYKNYEDFLRAYIFGSENNYRKANTGVSLSNSMTKRANEAYCQYMLSNWNLLEKKVAQELGVETTIANVVADSTDIYASGNWTYTEDDINLICNAIASSINNKETFYKFIAWNVDINGTNNIREQIKAVDAAIAKPIAKLLLLYHMSTGSFDMSIFIDNLRMAFELANMEYKTITKYLKDLEKFYEKLFFRMAKTNQTVAMAIRDYVVLNENSFGRADIRKTISKAVYGREDIKDHTVSNNDLKQLQEEAAYRYYQAIFMSRLFNNWIMMFGATLKQSGRMISWKRLCSIGESFTGEMISELTNYIRVFNDCSEDSPYRICQMAAILKSKEFAELFGAQYIDGNYNWKNVLIDYNKCSIAIPKLREAMKIYHHYDIKKSDDYIRRMILKLYGYMFTYKEKQVQVTIKCNNGKCESYTKDSTAIYIYGERKSIQSLDPIMLTFFNAANYKKKQGYESIPMDLREDAVELERRIDVNKYIVEEPSGKRYYDLEKLSANCEFLNLSEYYTVYVAKLRDLGGKPVYKCVGVASTDINGVLIHNKITLLDDFYKAFKHEDDIFRYKEMNNLIVPVESELIFRKGNELVVNTKGVKEELLRLNLI